MPLTDMPRVYYQCQRCTKCCQWPGDVNLTDDDLTAIAAFLRLSERAFVQEHTRGNKRRTGLSLLEKPNGECIWLDGIDCRLQAAKPHQCKGFPNTWNFPGWQDICEAIPVELPDEDPDMVDGPPEARAPGGR